MPIVTTDTGLNAIANAAQGGFLISFEKFAVTAFPDPVLNTGDVELQGNVLYEGQIDTIEVISNSTVRLTLTVPSGFPASGQWNLTEVGVYLKSGELFAHGKFTKPFEKTPEFGLKTYVYVTAARLGEVINITVSENMSLPSTPFVRGLQAPSTFLNNVCVVLDEHDDPDGFHSAGLAVKYGQGSLNWAFLGYDRVFNGKPDIVSSVELFSIDIEQKGGAWLNDGERVIAQVVSGPGVGESRRCRYNKINGSFDVLEKPFTSLNENAIISLWRSQSNQLPKRTADIPEYFVLGMGRNDWNKQTLTNEASRLIPVPFKFVADSSSSYPIAGLPPTAQDQTAFVLLYVDGRNWGPSRFSMAGDSIVPVDPIAVGAELEGVAFYVDQSQGGTLVFHEAEYNLETYTDLNFPLPIVPDNGAYCLVFVDDQLVSRTDYMFNDSYVLFPSTVAGKNLKILVFANYDEQNTGMTIEEKELTVAVNGQSVFSTDSPVTDRKLLVVHLDGKYVSQYDLKSEISGFSILNHDIVANSKVTVKHFIPQEREFEIGVSGRNTGPMWIDPAGVTGKPNLLRPTVKSFVTEANKRTYATGVQIPNKNFCLVFLDGTYKSPKVFDYDNLMKTITFYDEVKIVDGLELDVICFEELEDAGTEVDCVVTTFKANDSLTYPINAFGSEDSVIVTMGSVYQHKAKYTLHKDPNQLVLSDVVPGETIEVWSFSTKPKKGFRTDIHIDHFVTSPGNTYALKRKVKKSANTLVFLGYVHQNHDVYDLAQGQTVSSVQFDVPQLEVELVGLPLIVVNIVSEEPKTRLMLREEVESKYMPLEGPYVKWSNLTPHLKDMLACPILKLLGLMTGSIKADLNNPALTDDDKSLADKWGFQPVKKDLMLDLLPTASMASIGAAASLGIETKFNVYDYLELYLKEQLGDNTFSIRSYEQGKKYLIDDIKVGELISETIPRAQIPGMHKSVGIFPAYPAKVLSATFPGTPLLTTFQAMALYASWFGNAQGAIHGVVGQTFVPSQNKLYTVSVEEEEDSLTQTKTFTHVIHSDYVNGGEYTVKYRRPVLVDPATYNTDYLTLVDGGGAPNYVKWFARQYADYKLNDLDIRTCMYWLSYGGLGGEGTTTNNAKAWTDWLPQVGPGTANYPYPATAGYTAGLTFGVTVYDYDSVTGSAKMKVSMTSGDIGYSYFPANQFLKKVQFPVSYTIYPAMHVNPDGSVEPVLSNEDIFNSCCWTGVTPSTNLDCTKDGGSGTVDPGEVSTLVISVSPTSADATQPVTITVRNAAPGAAVSWESSDNPGVRVAAGVANAQGLFQHTEQKGGANRTITYKMYVDQVFKGELTVKIVTYVPGTATFDQPGEYTFTVPDAVQVLDLNAIAAGGGAAYSGNNSWFRTASGGSGAGFKHFMVPVNAGDILTIKIGSNGAYAANLSNTANAVVQGGKGGDTSIIINGVPYVLQGGMGGATNMTVGQAGSGGVTTAPNGPSYINGKAGTTTYNSGTGVVANDHAMYMAAGTGGGAQTGGASVPAGNGKVIINW